jgi:hypothetical protein
MMTFPQMALYYPGCFFPKSSGFESSNRFAHPCNEPSVLKERTKTIMVTKNPISKAGLSRFPNNAHEDFLLTNGEIFPGKSQNFK